MQDFWDGTRRHYRWQPVTGHGDSYTVEWTGYIRIDLSGGYGFGTISDDGSQVWIDGEFAVNNPEQPWYDRENSLGQNLSPGDFPRNRNYPGSISNHT